MARTSHSQNKSAVGRFISRHYACSHFESINSRLSKFAFLNHFHNSDLSTLLFDDTAALSPNIKRNYGNFLGLLCEDPPKEDVIDRLSRLLEVDRDVVPLMFKATFDIRDNPHYQSDGYDQHCQECDAKGFHSPIFSLPYLKLCPIHDRPLMTGCPICEKDETSKFFVDRLAGPYECSKGHVLWTTRNQPQWEHSICAKDADRLQNILSFLQQVKKIKSETISYIWYKHDVINFEPAQLIPMAASVILNGNSCVRYFETEPIEVEILRLWPNPPEPSIWVNGKCIKDICRYVLGEDLNLNESALEQIAGKIFDTVQTAVADSIKDHHSLCLEFQKFLPPNTSIKDWYKWCPALVAKHNWHYFWGYNAELHGTGYMKSTQTYWHHLRNIIQKINWRALMNDDMRNNASVYDTVSILLNISERLFSKHLLHTFVCALKAATPKQLDDGRIIDREQSGIRIPEDPPFLVIRDRDRPGIEMVFNKGTAESTDMISAISKTKHTFDYQEILGNTVKSLWEAYDKQRAQNILVAQNRP